VARDDHEGSDSSKALETPVLAAVTQGDVCARVTCIYPVGVARSHDGLKRARSQLADASRERRKSRKQRVRPETSPAVRYQLFEPRGDPNVRTPKQ
jgi:hypothetical protein